jgi:predicted regulator of Ras-like GTPase activity (Roadblock/LC7/MglB family)
MSFRTHLEAVVNQVDGALACSVMGFDGISVDTFQKDEAAELDVSGTWVEYANLLTQLKNAAESLKTGTVSEVSVNSEKVLTVMRLLTPDYFLVLALRADGNFGKGRYVLRVTAPLVKSEL